MPLMSANVIKNFFSGPRTRPYPVQKRKPFPGGRARIVHNPAQCTFCGICAHTCPTGAIRMEEDREALVIRRVYNSFACIYCARCMELCPDGALTIQADHHAPTDGKEVACASSKQV